MARGLAQAAGVRRRDVADQWQSNAGTKKEPRRATVGLHVPDAFLLVGGTGFEPVTPRV